MMTITIPTIIIMIPIIRIRIITGNFCEKMLFNA